MSLTTTDGALRPLKFANSNVANLVTIPADAPIETLLESLEVKSCDFILLALGAAPELPSATDAVLEQLSGPLLTVLAGLGRSVVVDTGTRNWITAPLYQRQAAKASQVTFLGVAPEDLVAYPGKPDQAASEEKPRQLDSWHSDIVLVQSEERWGSQLPTLHAVVSALASRSAYVPVLALLAGEGLCATEETLEAVRHGIPLVVVQGSGGLADDIVAALTPGNTEPTSDVIDDIIAEGQISVISLGNFLAEFTQLTSQLQSPDAVLTQAWENFAIYDLNAKYQQRHSSRINLSILALGVLGTILAVSKQVVYGSPKVPFNMAFTSITRHNFGVWLLYCSLLVIPIVLTILVAAAYKFKISSKWFVLRAGAEALKSEIYSYRARALSYQQNAAAQLALRMAEIMKRTMQSEASGSHLADYDKASGFPPYIDCADGADGGFGYLAPERYVEVRLEGQLRYFRTRTKTLDRQFQWLYWLTLLVGGAGTLLAAISQQVWIAVTASLTAALGALLTYRQTESNLLKFNQAATDLDNIKSWWKALSAAERARQVNIDFLVDRTEKVLQTELDGWVLQMKNALADLEKSQALTVEAAQKWRPAVRFTPRAEDEEQERATAAAARRMPQAAAFVKTDDVEIAVAISAPEPEPQEPAASQPVAVAAVTVGEVVPAETLGVPAQPASSLLVAVAANGLVASSHAPHKPKPTWQTTDITPDVLRQTLENQNFLWFDDQPNIIGIRTTNYTNNTFGDRIFCVWKQPGLSLTATLRQQQQFLADWGYVGKNGRQIVADGEPGPNTDFALEQLAKHEGRERIASWPVTTRPGTTHLAKNKNTRGCAVLAPGQYKNAYQLGFHRQLKDHKALVQRGNLSIYRDSDGNAVANESGRLLTGANFGINIHRANADSIFVNDWSAGCQVFKRIADHAAFLRICERFRARKNFTYTLLHEAALV